MFKTVSILMDMFKKDTSTSTRMQKNKMRINIENMLSEYLQDANDVFSFEVNKNDVNSVISVIDESPLKDKYIIWQDPDYFTLYFAKLKEVNVW